MQKYLTLNYEMKNEELLPVNEIESKRFENFVKGLKEGEKIELHFSIVSPNDKTLSQLAKIHAMIKELSIFSGDNVSEIKDEIKRNTGLYENVEESGKIKRQLKSFADCSKEELNLAINRAIEIGHIIGCPVD